MNTFRPGQKVRVATATGLRDAVITTGRVSKLGTIHVAIQYAHDTRHRWTCVSCFGRPRPFDVRDVEPRRAR